MCVMMLRALFRILWVVCTMSGDLLWIRSFLCRKKCECSDWVCKHYIAIGKKKLHIAWYSCYSWSHGCVSISYLFIYLFSNFHLVKMTLQRKKKKWGTNIRTRSPSEVSSLGFVKAFFLNHITFLLHHFNQGSSLAKIENNALGQLVLIIGIVHQIDYTPNPFHAKQEKSIRKRQYESMILNTLNCKVWLDEMETPY